MQVRSISAIARPRDPVADAISRLVVDTTWTGTPVELFAALDLVTTADERQAFAWPRTATALAARFRSLSDALWAHRLRVTHTPSALLIERMGDAA